MKINKIRQILMDSRIHREVSVRFGGEGASVPLAYGTKNFNAMPMVRFAVVSSESAIKAAMDKVFKDRIS